MIISSFQEWANAMARRPSSVRPSVCKLLRKSLVLVDKWPDRHQTWTWWTPGQRASRVCSRSRSRSKVTWYAHFLKILGMSYSVIDGLVLLSHNDFLSQCMRYRQYPVWVHCCKRPNYDICISHGSVATVFTWGGQNYSHLRYVSSWCCMPKIK